MRGLVQTALNPYRSPGLTVVTVTLCSASLSYATKQVSAPTGVSLLSTPRFARGPNHLLLLFAPVSERPHSAMEEKAALASKVAGGENRISPFKRRDICEWLLATTREVAQKSSAEVARRVYEAVLDCKEEQDFKAKGFDITALVQRTVSCCSTSRWSGDVFSRADPVACSRLLLLPVSQQIFKGVALSAPSGAPGTTLPRFSLEVRRLTRSQDSKEKGLQPFVCSVRVDGVGRYQVELEAQVSCLPRVRIDARAAPCVGGSGKDESAALLKAVLLPFEWRSLMARILHDRMQPQLLLNAVSLLYSESKHKGRKEGSCRRRFCTDGAYAYTRVAAAACKTCKARGRLQMDISLHAVSGGCLAVPPSEGGVPTLRLSACVGGVGGHGQISTKRTACLKAVLFCNHRQKTSRACFCSQGFTDFSAFEAEVLFACMHAAREQAESKSGIRSSSSSKAYASAAQEWQNEQTVARKRKNVPLSFGEAECKEASKVLAKAILGRQKRACYPPAVTSASTCSKRAVDLSHLLPATRLLEGGATLVARPLQPPD